MTSRHVLLTTLATFGGAKKGGGERYVSELGKALLERGWNVQVASIPQISTVSIEDLSSGTRTVGVRAFKRAVAVSDVVHVHQLNSPGFDYAALACKTQGVPLVLTDHGGGAMTPGRFFGKVRLRAVSSAAFVSACSRADIDPGGRIQSSRVIWGGGDHLPNAGLLSRTYDFVFVGRILPHKGLHVALEAIQSDASLIVVGKTRNAEYLAHLQQLAKDRDVTFVSDASDELVAQAHRSVGHLLVPSVERYESETYVRPELLGLVALEALAVGTRVIGSDVGGLGELLRHAGQTPVAPGDVTAWRAVLEAAREEPLALMPDTPLFTWGRVADECIAMYEEQI